MAINRKLASVILLGVGFMLIFTAFQTQGNIQQTMIKSIKTDDPSFDGDGYISLAIIYGVFSISNWIAPSVIALIGPVFAMVIGGIAYLLFIMSFLIPHTWLLYFASSIIGVGAALIWTAQGNYMTLNSSQATISRNSGIFWAMFQLSFLIGNAFVFVQFKGLDQIEKSTRTTVVWTLTGICIAGIIVILLLPRPRKRDRVDDERQPGPIKVLKGAAKLSVTRNMLLLSITFFYTGIATSFITGVYGTCIGFTTRFPSSKELIGLSGIFVGVGEVIGGAAFGILGSKTSKWGRDPIVIGGFVIHMISFFLIFLNLPNDSPFYDTNGDAFIESNQYLAIFCSFLLGFGDACFNTQVYSILGGVYPNNSAAAFAIFKFVQSIAAAISFIYTTYLVLYGQLGILAGLAILGTIGFVLVEWAVKKKPPTDDSIDSVEDE